MHLLADRVVGKAIALLCAYANIKEVYAAVMSRKAQVIFKQNKISCYWNELVENVLDQSRDSMCPFEKAAAEISEPQKAYDTFVAMLKSTKPAKS